MGPDIKDIIFTENLLYLVISWVTCKILKMRMTSDLSFRNMTLPVTGRMDYTTGRLIIIQIISCHLLWVRHYVSDLHRFNDLIIIETIRGKYNYSHLPGEEDTDTLSNLPKVSKPKNGRGRI